MINIKWHFYFWAIYFVLVYIIDSILDPYATFVKELIFFLTQNILLFYSLVYVLRKFSTKTKLQLFFSIGRLLLAIGVFIAVRYFVRYYFIATFFDPEYGKLPIRRWFPGCFVWIINMFFYALWYFYYENSFKKQQDLMKAVEEKLTNENIALRAQINPHFLYNTLDMLYSKAFVKDNELADAILRLADVMRYSIKPPEQDGLVNLTDEIKHLENVIEINRQRFNHSINLEFSYVGQMQGVRIIPLILITLVENVFKYGTLNDKEHPARIALRIAGNKFQFTTNNLIRKGPKELSTGIGVENARKRLDNEYGTCYSLVIAKQDDRYSTTLNILL